MEPISEEKQRKVYEWAFPELKGKPWRYLGPAQHMANVASDAVWEENGKNEWLSVPPLYLRNGVPNYQWFVTEAVPKLKAERVTVRFGFAGDDYFYIDPIDADDAYGNPDPIAALAEYVEVTGEA